MSRAGDAGASDVVTSGAVAIDATMRADATRALAALRRTTVLRSVRANARWAMRAIGWGSIVYLGFWTVILVIGAVQSVTPLPAAVQGHVAAWAAPIGAGLLALAALAAARATVTPLWLDRRDLAHLTGGAAPAGALLTWPALRTALPALIQALLVALALTLLVPRWLGVAAYPALLVLPALALGLRTLRWRAALTGARDPVAWALASVTTASALASLACAGTGAHGCALVFAAPVAAAIGGLPSTVALAVAAGVVLGVLALLMRTAASTTRTLPTVVVLQSEFLAELRAIATLRGLSVLTGVGHDPGARFAAVRARAALQARDRPPRPRWRPPVPSRGGAPAAFAWLGVVRAWRAAPAALLALPLVTVAAAATLPATGPFGAAALLPSLAFAWAAAQLAPGRLGWPGFAVDVHARTGAALLTSGLVAFAATVAASAARAAFGVAPVAEAWVLVPLALGAAALVDLIGARAADPRGVDVWLLAGVLATSPAALLGWSGVEPGIAAPLTAVVWSGVAWLRWLATPRFG